MAIDRRPRRARKLELYKLVLARSDMAEAIDAGKHLLSLPPLQASNPLNMALQNAVVIAYARPFAGGRGGYGPLPAVWGRFSEPRLQSIHDAMLLDRDRLKAHSDPRERVVVIVPRGTVIAGTRTTLTTVSVRNAFYGRGMVRTAVDAAMDLGRRLDEAVDDRIDKLFGALPIGAEPFDLNVDDDA